MTGKVYIGIAGWSYPDWKGIVYPDSKTDQLEYVSRLVDCVEINNTFYRPPDAKIVGTWLAKASAKPDFFFTAKLHRDFTHEGKIEARTVKQFRDGFSPMLEAGKLNRLLAQFRYDFDDTNHNRRHLTKIIEAFSDTFSIAVEVRHKSWQMPEALKFLDGLRVSVCNLDYPTTYNSFDLRLCAIGRDGYFRLHGRNADKWFSKSTRNETYDYYYNENELAQIKLRIDELAKALRTLTVITNNHYRGAELANAIELKCLTTGRKQAVPEGLLKTYPQLAKVASNG
ncbi:MAG: DUF72 domain-containing protein [Sedimentisphaerales bacterium]|nr:DUF72 domain-containing protein [Sedimentisphaerales bacterium]